MPDPTKPPTPPTPAAPVAPAPTGPRTLTDHHDGHGLADSITIEADPRDPAAGNASHRYVCTMPVPGQKDPSQVAFVQFQHGARTKPDSKPGVVEGVLLAILIDRLQGFQEGPFRCRENAIALTHLEEALLWVKERAHRRARRGVLGTDKV